MNNQIPPPLYSVTDSQPTQNSQYTNPTFASIQPLHPSKCLVTQGGEAEILIHDDVIVNQWYQRKGVLGFLNIYLWYDADD